MTADDAGAAQNNALHIDIPVTEYRSFGALT
jgi:hypothetical protein